MALWPDIGTRYLQENIVPGEGVDTFHSPIQLAPGQASDMQDFSSRLYPALQTRDGRRQVYAPFVGYQFRRIHVSPDGVLHVLNSASLTSDWYYWNTTTDAWTLIQTSADSYGYQFADWFDNTSGEWIVFHTRPDPVAGYSVTWWDGSTTGTVAYATFPATYGPMCSHLNRMFCTCKSTFGNLGFSKLNDPYTWTNVISVGNGGVLPIGSDARIHFLHSMPDRMFIGTDKGIFVLFGSDEETFVVKPVTTTIGLPDGDSACGTQNAVYFTDGNSVYEYTINGIQDITHVTPTNGVIGGFADFARDSIDPDAADVRRLYSIGTDGRRVYVTTNVSSTGCPDWYVFDIQKRRWYIERGTYQTIASDAANSLIYGTISWRTSTAFARTPGGRLLASAFYYASEYLEYPRIYELDASQAYDTYMQYNLVTDGAFVNAASWTPVAGVDAIAGGYYQLTGDGSAAGISTYQNTAHAAVVGHNVFARLNCRVTNPLCTEIKFEIRGSTGGAATVATIANPTINTWYIRSAIVTMPAGTTGVIRPYITHTYADAIAANGKILECDYIVVDDISFTYQPYNLPLVAEYENELPAGGYFDKLNATSYWNVDPTFSYVSPAFQISPSAKKTLKNIYITADLTGITGINVSQSTDLDSSSFTMIYSTTTTPSKAGVTRLKVPVSVRDKAEWVRIKIAGAGQAKILNIALDWRIQGRAK